MRDEIGSFSALPLEDVACVRRNAEDAAELLRVIGSPHRLTILCLLLERAHTVNELCEALQIRQSLVSQHLARLRACGLVQAQREANRSHYHLTDEAALDVITVLARRYRAGGQARVS